MLLAEDHERDDDLAELFTRVTLQGEASKGGNSSVYRAPWKDGFVAVKDYRARSDFQTRAFREWNGLSMLWSSGLRIAPQPIAASPQTGRIVMEWIGEVQDSSLMSPEEAIALLRELQRGDAAPTASSLGDAADAISSPEALLEQVSARAVGLRGRTSVDAVVDEILDAHELLGSHSPHPSDPIVVLSPSDFGPHNCIRGDQGLRIIDLEFFGWDDAHKLVADTFLHPMNPWSDDERRVFVDSARDLYRLDDDRLGIVVQFAALKWATIIAARANRCWSEGDLRNYATSLDLASTYAARALESWE